MQVAELSSNTRTLVVVLMEIRPDTQNVTGVVICNKKYYSVLTAEWTRQS